MLMAKAFYDIKCAKSQKVYELIKSTCLAIFRENKDKILPALKEKLDTYTSDQYIRLPDSIPSNAIFLCQLYCA